ncbi:hypothetical protein KKF38_03530 [Patescibacteria group bacterium]|nr:hypothetical protein [Patescibacteria group bacterium]
MITLITRDGRRETKTEDEAVRPFNTLLSEEKNPRNQRNPKNPRSDN